jgi:small subunit ribosomal protein S6
MNNYEGIFVIKPDIKEDDMKNVTNAICEAVTKQGGVIKKEEPWGKKPLAYPIKKFKEAHYYKLDFEAESAAIAKLEDAYKMNADIIRMMITRR